MSLAKRWYPLFPKVGLQRETRLQHCAQRKAAGLVSPLLSLQSLALLPQGAPHLEELFAIRGGAPLLAPRLRVIHSLFMKLFNSTSRKHSQFSYKIQRQMAVQCP